MMRRKRVPAFLLLAVFVCFQPLPSSASDKVIGVVFPECCQAYETAAETVKGMLTKAGHKAENIYIQKPSTDPMSWTNAFRKFVGVDADLIIVFGDELVEIACSAKAKVPVVFGFVTNPERAKCVKSAASPGGYVTGVSGKTPIHTLLEKTRRIKPFKSLGVFSLKGDGFSAHTLKEIEKLGQEQGFAVVPIELKTRSGAADALTAAPPFDVLFLPNFSIGQENVHHVITAAAARNTPTLSLRPADAGYSSLLSLYPDPAEQGRLVGEMALDILGGGDPGTTAIRSPKQIELELDIAAAKGLGLKVPLDILKSATKVRK